MQMSKVFFEEALEACGALLVVDHIKDGAAARCEA